MSDEVETPPRVTTPAESAGSAPAYVPPLIERLGTLADLTRGGTEGPDDGLGGGGDDGTL